MSDVVRVIQYGLGPIGSAMARHVLERKGLCLVGGVDVDQAKVGRDLGAVIAVGHSLGIPVHRTLADVLRCSEADLVLHTTASHAADVKTQVLEILRAGLDIVSTSEELSFPWKAHAADASEIDAAAKQSGQTILATGINPGFLMDSLPLYLTAICQSVDHIEVRRAQNASLRRGPFQAKIGAGLTVQQFEARMAAGRIGHVGLSESADMISNTLGRRLVDYREEIRPVIAERAIETPFFSVYAGQVAGLEQVAHAYTAEGEFLTLSFVAVLDWPENQDAIRITGRPNLEVVLQGTNGDIATVAIAVNAIRRVREAPPGLLTMRDLPLLTFW